MLYLLLATYTPSVQVSIPPLARQCCISANSVAPSVECKLSVDVSHRQTDRQKSPSHYVGLAYGLTPTIALYGYSYKAVIVIFDIRALRRSALSVRVPRCQKLQMTALLLHAYDNSGRQRANDA